MKASPFTASQNVVLLEIFCCDPSRGGRNYIRTWFFFLQIILTDRYIHRTYLRVVSLKSPSSVEYGNKKTFSNFVFYRELSRFAVLWKLHGHPLFFSHFPEFRPKILSILFKIVKIVNNSTVNFMFGDRKSVVDNFQIIFLAKTAGCYKRIQ